MKYATESFEVLIFRKFPMCGVTLNNSRNTMSFHPYTMYKHRFPLCGVEYTECESTVMVVLRGYKSFDVPKFCDVAE